LERNYTRIVDGDENSNMTNQIVLSYDEIKAAIAAYVENKRGGTVNPNNIRITEHPMQQIQQMQQMNQYSLSGPMYSATVKME
jgi:hypothetical protein